MDELGLFPLGIVLLPGERVPLHVFEPRYRELIAECLDSGRPFGLVLADERDVRPVGTRAAVVEVLERFEDGRLNVIVEGRERFRIVELRGGRAFHLAAVDDVSDEDDPADEQAREAALELFRELRTVAEADVDDPPPDEDVAYAIAARVDFGADAKQELLESRSERVRLARVVELLRIGIKNARRIRERADIASRNGHLRDRP